MNQPRLGKNISVVSNSHECENYKPPQLMKLMSSQIENQQTDPFDDIFFVYKPSESFMRPTLSRQQSQVPDFNQIQLTQFQSQMSLRSHQQKSIFQDSNQQIPLQKQESQTSRKSNKSNKKKIKKIESPKNQNAFKPIINKKIKKNELEQQPCNCRNSGCLKRYCRCFHSGRMCLKDCQCAEACLNNDNHPEERQNAVKHVNEKCHRNKNVPKDELFKLTQSYGCNCKNTRCQKGYCECFLRKQKCSIECQCENCENGLDEAYLQSQKQKKSYRQR